MANFGKIRSELFSSLEIPEKTGFCLSNLFSFAKICMHFYFFAFICKSDANLFFTDIQKIL